MTLKNDPVMCSSGDAVCIVYMLCYCALTVGSSDSSGYSLLRKHKTIHNDTPVRFTRRKTLELLAYTIRVCTTLSGVNHSYTEVAIGCHPPTSIIWAPPLRCASGCSVPVCADLAPLPRMCLLALTQPSSEVCIV